MKIVKIFAGCVFALNISNAVCFCTIQFDQAFQNLTNEVVETWQNHSEAINKLIPEIIKNTLDIKQQNEVLKKLVEGEKKKALQNAEIVFTLEKIIELKNTGEMR